MKGLHIEALRSFGKTRMKADSPVARTRVVEDHVVDSATIQSQAKETACRISVGVWSGQRPFCREEVAGQSVREYT